MKVKYYGDSSNLCIVGIGFNTKETFFASAAHFHKEQKGDYQEIVRAVDNIQKGVIYGDFDNDEDDSSFLVEGQGIEVDGGFLTSIFPGDVPTDCYFINLKDGE